MFRDDLVAARERIAQLERELAQAEARAEISEEKSARGSRWRFMPRRRSSLDSERRQLQDLDRRIQRRTLVTALPTVDLDASVLFVGVASKRRRPWDRKNGD